MYRVYNLKASEADSLEGQAGRGGARVSNVMEGNVDAAVRKMYALTRNIAYRVYRTEEMFKPTYAIAIKLSK